MNIFRAASAFKNHKFYLSVSLCTLSGAIIYTFLKNKQKNQINFVPDDWPNAKIARGSIHTVDSKGVHKVKLIVENQSIPKLREPIKDIEEQTKTTITFSSINQHQGTHQICIISGGHENVKEARAWLLREVECLSIVKEEIQVPRDICLNACKNDHEAIQQLSRLSTAKVDASFCLETDIRKLRIIVSGTKQEVSTARKLIEDTVREWEKLSQSKEKDDNVKNKIIKQPNPCNSEIQNPQHMQQHQNNRLFEVYISAVASPSKFWIQLVGQPSSQLSELVKAMTTFYGNCHNRADFLLKKPQFGQLIAVQFPRDNRWYRAEIMGAAPNKANPNEILLDLYFVDYGNSEYITPTCVYELHEQFMRLSYQAAECFLSNIISTIPNKPEMWEDETTNYFEKITEVVAGKKLICQVVTYKPRVIKIGGRNKIIEVPGIELFYTLEGVVVNVGQTLVSHGFAQSATDLWSTVYDAEILKSKEKNFTNEKNCVIEHNKNDLEFMQNSKKYMEHVNNANTTCYDEHFYATSKCVSITKEQMCSEKIVTSAN